MTNTAEGIVYDLDAVLAQARELGDEHGKSSASWIEFPGGDFTAQECLRMDEDGDPEWDDRFGCRSPLSGEFADDMTPGSLLGALDVEREALDDAAMGEIMDAYESAVFDAHRDEVLKRASSLL